MVRRSLSDLVREETHNQDTPIAELQESPMTDSKSDPKSSETTSSDASSRRQPTKADLVAQMAELETDLAAVRASEAELKEKLADLQGYLDQASKLKQVHDQAQVELAELKAANKTLTAQLKQATAAQASTLATQGTSRAALATRPARDSLLPAPLQRPISSHQPGNHDDFAKQAWLL